MHAIPQPLIDSYGRWCDLVPDEVLADLTEPQLVNRLRRAEARWNESLGEGGDGNLIAALNDTRTIMSAPVTGAKRQSSALKAAGITTPTMEQHGRWISRIPEDVLRKLDEPRAVERAQRAAALEAQGRPADAQNVLSAAPDIRFTGEMLTKAAAEAVQRGVREDLARQYDRWLHLIPDSVLVKIGAVELADRCDYARAMDDKVRTAETSYLAQGYSDLIRSHLAARPRADVDAEAARLTKAALLAEDRALAIGYREAAALLKADNPQVPALPRPQTGAPAAAVPARPSPVLYKAAPPPEAQPRPKQAARPKAKDDLARGLELLETALLLLKADHDDRARKPLDDAKILFKVAK